MQRFKVGTFAMLLIGCMGLGATLASSAEAGSWFVNGTKLAKGATVAVADSAQVDESTTFNSPSLGVRVTCSGGEAREVEPKIQGEVDFGAGSVALLGCSEISPSTCTVQSTLETEPVVGSAETGTAPLDRVRFAPKSGNTLATIDISGSCAESGEQAVNGKYVMAIKTGQTESAAALLEGQGTTENNSLELFKDKLYVVGGKALLKLASGQPWSFR